jgi:hypothetical protein
MCGKQKTLSTCVFGSVARKGVTYKILGCVANERLSGKECPSTALGTSLPRLAGLGRGVLPLSLCKKESRNGRKGKEIEGIFRWKTAGLQRGDERKGTGKI